MRCSLIAALVVSMLTALAAGQGSRADYERAAMRDSGPLEMLISSRVDFEWIDEGKALWCKAIDAGHRRRWIRVDVATGTRSDLFDAALLGEKLRAQGVPASDRSGWITRMEVDADGAWALVVGSDKAWRINFDPFEVAPHPLHVAAPLRIESTPPRATNRLTRILISNIGPHKIEAFWISGDGDERSYGVIEAGSTRDQNTFGGHRWVFRRADGTVMGRYAAPDEPSVIVFGDRPNDESLRPSAAERRRSADDQTSPDGTQRLISSEGTWAIREVHGDRLRKLDLALPEGFSLSTRLTWSPNGHALFALAERAAPEHIVTLVESSPSNQVQPRTHTFNYLKPGDEIPRTLPVLVDVETGRRIPIDESLFPNPWSIDRLEWDSDGSGFTFLYNQRGHQVMRVLHVDAATGAVRAIVNEECPTFFDYTNKTFLHRLHETRELIWMSERSGWNHLYLIDEATGAVKNPVTSGAFVVRSIEWVDEANRQVWFNACGLDPSGEPYYVHFCRVNFDGTGFTVLTADASGTHEVEFSPDKKTFVDVYSTTELPPQTVLRRSDDGSRIAVLGEPGLELFSRVGLRPPERFTAKGRDGATDICGLIFRPSNFDPAKSYPVIENIYAGPHDAHVPKAFTTNYGVTELAELGFIVVRIDGMGTNWRSKAFHDVCWKNLVDAGLPDRIAWMRAAQASVCPQMDLSRVGIYGGSAGGQNALAAVLTHPEFYKAAAADCGCHDNRMDKIWWNEMWMGWPVGPHYAEQSNVTLAPNLQGKLLLTVGELDRNVDPASTMQVVNALIKADKDFEFIIVPGAGHGAGESPYGRRRRQDFFVRALMGVEPRWE